VQYMSSTRIVVLHNYTARSERDGRAEDSGAPQISIAMHFARIMPGLLLEGR